MKAYNGVRTKDDLLEIVGAQLLQHRNEMSINLADEDAFTALEEMEFFVRELRRECSPAAAMDGLRCALTNAMQEGIKRGAEFKAFEEWVSTLPERGFSAEEIEVIKSFPKRGGSIDDLVTMTDDQIRKLTEVCDRNDKLMRADENDELSDMTEKLKGAGECKNE